MKKPLSVWLGLWGAAAAMGVVALAIRATRARRTCKSWSGESVPVGIDENGETVFWRPNLSSDGLIIGKPGWARFAGPWEVPVNSRRRRILGVGALALALVGAVWGTSKRPRTGRSYPGRLSDQRRHLLVGLASGAH